MRFGWLGVLCVCATALATACGTDDGADDADTLAVAGTGPLATLGTFGFRGPSTPYEDDFPDVLAEGSTVVKLLRYPTGEAAAVGVAGSCVLVGSALELVDEPDTLRELVTALISFVEGG